jgi:hypothetical protein
MWVLDTILKDPQVWLRGFGGKELNMKVLDKILCDKVELNTISLSLLILYKDRP